MSGGNIQVISKSFLKEREEQSSEIQGVLEDPHEFSKIPAINLVFQNEMFYLLTANSIYPHDHTHTPSKKRKNVKDQQAKRFKNTHNPAHPTEDETSQLRAKNFPDWHTWE